MRAKKKETQKKAKSLQSSGLASKVTSPQMRPDSSTKKLEDSVTPGSEPFLIPVNPYDLSMGADTFIWKQESWINDETLHFLRNAFKGFRDEVQDKMAECLRSYFEDCGPEGDSYLPLLGIEHIDMLLHLIVYKIEHGRRTY